MRTYLKPLYEQLLEGFFSQEWVLDVKIVTTYCEVAVRYDADSVSFDGK